MVFARMPSSRMIRARKSGRDVGKEEIQEKGEIGEERDKRRETQVREDRRGET